MQFTVWYWYSIIVDSVSEERLVSIPNVNLTFEYFLQQQERQDPILAQWSSLSSTENYKQDREKGFEAEKGRMKRGLVIDKKVQYI